VFSAGLINATVGIIHGSGVSLRFVQRLYNEGQPPLVSE
jgi:hypothetical protein